MKKPISWDFAQSWASNLSVAGGAINVAIFGFLPAEAESPAGQLLYATMAAAFALLSTSAPVVYNLFKHRPTKGTYEGRPLVFILAGVITMTASMGQLAVSALILQQLKKYVPGLLCPLLQLLASGLGLLILLYGGRSIVETLETPDDPAKPQRNFAFL